MTYNLVMRKVQLRLGPPAKHTMMLLCNVRLCASLPLIAQRLLQHQK